VPLDAARFAATRLGGVAALTGTDQILLAKSGGERGFWALKTRKVFQCDRCKKQLSLTAGTVFQDSKLPLTAWFSAIYHLTQSKGGISSIELGRRLGSVFRH
jgi:transposase-like protein